MHFSWHEIPFATALILGLVLVGLASLGLESSGGGDAGADGVPDDVDLDGDGVPDDVDCDGDAEIDGVGSGGSALGTALAFLGVGRAPMLVVLSTALLSFGTSGFALAWTLDELGLGAMRWLALPFASVAAMVLTRALASALGRFMPSTESYASKPRDLLGSLGVVVVDAGARGAFARVRDRGGSELAVRCRSPRPLPKGVEVVLIDRDDDGVYLVEPMPEDPETPAR